MATYLIDMPEGWKIGHCEWIITDGNKHFFCPNHKKCWRDGSPIPCPLANAKKGVEVNTFKTQEGYAYTGRGVKVYAVEDTNELAK